MKNCQNYKQIQRNIVHIPVRFVWNISVSEKEPLPTTLTARTLTVYSLFGSRFLIVVYTKTAVGPVLTLIERSVFSLAPFSWMRML